MIFWLFLRCTYFFLIRLDGIIFTDVTCTYQVQVTPVSNSGRVKRVCKLFQGIQVNFITLSQISYLSKFPCQYEKLHTGNKIESDTSCSKISYLVKCQDTGLLSGIPCYWRNYCLIQVFLFCNADTVRGLAVMPDLGFLSASHDG